MGKPAPDKNITQYNRSRVYYALSSNEFFKPIYASYERNILYDLTTR